MSYTDQVKQSLFDATRSHWAELSGFLRSSGSLQGSKFPFSSKEETLARYFFAQLRSQGVRAKFLGRQSGYSRFPRYEVMLTAASPFLRKIHVIEESGQLVQTVPFETLEGELSRRAYLRGLFLGSGSLSSPEKGYQLTFRLREELFAKSLISFLSDYDIPASLRTSRGAYKVSIQAAEHLSSVLALIGATSALLELEDLRILRGMRADVNRSVNFETANIAKTVATSQKQIRCIDALAKRVGLLNLPEDLVEVALLRSEYPEMSLAQIGERLEKPLSKSGVHHRLRRILALCEEMGEEIE